ncbi:hypothetical protein N0B44_06035 [Roseibacterium beibuensis]|uniref:Uncharacterized protein n=2 Tax=[Roseibacterium] beibuensis TaxID=1193142 RepID=A0ABP9KUJ6_9RHOB|nr:hypothetical protein [Roseibacterium beibuensis]
MGWVEVYPGFRHYGEFDGGVTVEIAKARRLRATQSFLGLAEEHQIYPDTPIQHFRKDHAVTSPVEVKTSSIRNARGKKVSKKMKPPQSPKLRMAMEQVREINAFMEQHSFSLEQVPQFKRVFNKGDEPSFDYDLGGRLYCIAAGTG